MIKGGVKFGGLSRVGRFKPPGRNEDSMKKIIVIGMALLAISLFSMQAFSADQKSAQGKAAQLNEAQVKDLMGIKLKDGTYMKIAIPIYIPSGFVLRRINTNKTFRFGPSYELIYEKPGKHSLTVEGTNGGIGNGIGAEKKYTCKTALFGTNTLYWHQKDDYFITEWMKESSREFPVYHVTGKGLAPQEGVKVTESLRFLSR